MKKSFVYSLLFLLPWILSAAQKPKITWVINDAAPYYIDQGDLKGQGFGDLTQKMVMNAMPDHTHEIVRKPLSRVMMDFEYGKEICFSTWIYASTPKIAVTTIPNIYYPPLGIIASAKKRSEFNSPVSLKETLENTLLIFGQAKGRGYGDKLDAIIEPHRGEKHFKVRSASEDPTEGILKMIEYGRIHYTMDYPHALSYYTQLTGKKERLVFLPIQETHAEGVKGAIACSLSPWGKKTVKAMNKAILKVRNTPEYKAILKRWLIPGQNVENYWKQYEKQVLEITQ